MRRIVLHLILVAGVSGCDGGDSKPNPEMKVPDIPPGRANKVEPLKAPKR